MYVCICRLLMRSAIIRSNDCYLFFAVRIINSFYNGRWQLCSKDDFALYGGHKIAMPVTYIRTYVRTCIEQLLYT